jgi:hypothetical protein
VSALGVGHEYFVTGHSGARAGAWNLTILMWGFFGILATFAVSLFLYFHAGKLSLYFFQLLVGEMCEPSELSHSSTGGILDFQTGAVLPIEIRK